MQTVRIHKDNLREHILRTLFFTDTAIFVGIGGIIAIIIVIVCRLIIHTKQLGVIISTIFLTELIYALIATIKIEKQPIYKIIPRACVYAVKQKSFTMQQIKKTTGDFTITGNYIIRQKKLIALYEIHPTDIALRNDEQRERYYQHIKTMLHTLPGKIQIITKKNTATVQDYDQHFFSLFETANKKVNWLIENYVKELSNLIQPNSFQIMKYYIAFSTPLVSESDDNFLNAAQKLEDYAKRTGNTLALEGVLISQLTNQQLINYFKTQFKQL